MKFALKSLLAAAFAVGAAAGQAAVVQIDSATSQYTALFTGSGVVTFDETQIVGGVVVGGGGLTTVNPVYQAVGPNASGAGFTTGSFFAGQHLGELQSGGTSSCGPSGITNCVLGTPSSTLALAPGGTATVVTDSAHAGSPTLAGSSDFAQGDPIAILFSTAVSAFSFDAGGFNNVGSTLVQVFSTTGALLASAVQPGVCTVAPCPPNTISPQLFTFAFYDNGGVNSIGGVLISLIGVEEEGFSIDNVHTVVASGSPSTGSPSTGSPSTGSPSSSNGGTNQAPEPTSMALVGLALITLALARRRKSRVAV